MDQQDAIQAAHCNTKRLSIFTSHAWCEANSYSFALVPDNVSHDKYYVGVCLNTVISQLRQYLPVSQFKQRYLFQNLTRIMVKNYLKLLRIFLQHPTEKGFWMLLGYRETNGVARNNDKETMSISH
jgi:hypothetical protein